jgi:hypothetical protein
MYGKDSESLKSYKTILSPIRGPNQRGLRNFKQKVKNGTGLKNKSKIARILFEYYKFKSTAQ